MHRLLLSLGLALLLGGIAIAVNADQPFGDLEGSDAPSTEQAPADLPLVSPDLPLVDEATPGLHETGPSVADHIATPAEPACREEVLAKFRPVAAPATVAARYGASIVSSIPQIGVYVLAVPPGTQAETIAALSADPDVEFAEPNGVVRIPEQPPTADPCAGSPTVP
ncbi:MAG: hypothetical protein M3O34_06925 [Chloroflexota bacterium]|nr:hypothetical protein [Chloroflexota bacterium]